MTGNVESHGTWDRVIATPEDPRFPSLQQGFNRRWVGHNIDSVYIVHTPKGACEAVDDACSRYSPGTVKVVSGGHCYENFVFNDSVKAIINVTALQHSGKHHHRGFFLSSGDTNWNSFKTVFRNYGKVLPGGSCYSVGLGGHISGGGDGILSRLHGLTVDYLTGVEIVVKPDPQKPAELKYVTRECADPHDVDLYWAHTGGGPGNYGVITKYYFKTLPDAPVGIVASNITFNWKDITEHRLEALLNWYFDLAENEQLPKTVGKFPIFHKSAGEFVLFLYTPYDNESERHEALGIHYELEQELSQLCPISVPTKWLGGHGGYAPFPLRPRKLHKTKQSFVSDVTLCYPTYTLTQTINGSGPNQRGKYKSAYMKKRFPKMQIKAIFKHLTSHIVPDGLEFNDLKDSLLQVDIFGGRINEVDADYTAIPQRAYVVKLQYQTYWPFEKDDAGHLKWIRDFYNEMYEPYGGVPDPKADGGTLFQGCYYNYPDVDLNEWRNGKEGALYLYFIDNLPRLIRAKNTWDPCDYFSHAQSIPLEACIGEPKGGAESS